MYKPQTVSIRFGEHKFRGTGKYKCKCGNKFQRVETSYWTENPYNKRWTEGDIVGLNKECENDIEKNLAKKECPKCGEIVKKTVK